ncbi:MAG: pseudaminic acid synthase [Candidatus Saganbacteria bacterium]|nr:pseudaminic acid synthase [Candidatus Saganbacteria bacterium]
MKIKIGKRSVGEGCEPLIVAEMSGNHNRSLKRALAIVDAAAKAGVHALKIQTYTADTMTLDLNCGEFFIKDKKSLWKGKSLYELYKRAATPWEWHKVIFDRCREHGIIGFSTPFDATAVDFLEKLNVPCYKIASCELVDIPLIKKAASTGKPLLMSTGMATRREIAEAIGAARKAGCRKLVLLKCTSSYPADPKDSNLETIYDMKKRFGCEVGLSDHTLGIGVSLASIALGAAVIEKHFTLSRKDGGVDSVFSMEPDEMRMLVEEASIAWRSLGKISYELSSKEKKSLVFRRSLYAIKDIKKGETITKDNVRSIRPGLGLPPKYIDDIIGRKINRNITKGTPMRWDIMK